MIRLPSLRRLTLICAAGAATCSLRAQEGAVDATYNPSIDGSVRYLAVQPDGRAIVSGDFRTVNGTPRTGLTRLDADGTLDPLYNPNSIAKGGPIALQPDGTVFATDADNHVVRINADGRANPAFNGNATNAGPGGMIHSLAVQPDGKILFGGDFNQVGAIFTDGVGRLNADGTFDASFVSHAGFYSVKAIVLLPDGSSYVAGGNGSGNAAHPVEMAHLSADGAVLATYDATPGANASSAEISRLQVQADGKILLSGRFATIQGVARANIARLNPDGSVDASFDPGTGPANFDTILDLLLQADGKVLAAGGFTTFDGTTRNRVARLNSDGSVDPSFDPGAGAGSVYGEFNGVQALAIQPDGKVLVGGDFDQFGGVAHQALARLDSGTTTPPPAAGKQADLGLNAAKPVAKLGAGGTRVKFKVSLVIANNGKKKAKRVEVAAYLSGDPTLDSADLPLGTIAAADYGILTIPKKGVTRSFRAKFAARGVGLALKGKYVILVIDPDGAIPDSDRTNNQVVVGPLP